MSSEDKPVIVAEERRISLGNIPQAVFLTLGGVAMATLFYQGSRPAISWLIERVSGKVETIPHLDLSRFSSALLGLLIGVGLANLIWDLLDKVRVRLQRSWSRVGTGGRVTLALGIFVALVASVPFLFFLYTFLASNLLAFLGALFLLITGFSLLSIYVLQSIEDILPWNRGEAAQKRSGIKILDTNVIIDGRVDDVIRTGFLEGPFYVPQFVLEELQHIADSADPLRRQRGRRGLEVLRFMQADFEMEVGTKDRLAGNARDEVDSRLIKLAKALGADIVTNDFNLNRVAKLQDVRVLNMNDLALATRSNILPQESIQLAVVREGNQPYQGVGYLEDGTMVVVENGKRFIGETIDIVVSQVIQTERGKMIFAAPADDEPDEESYRTRRTNPRRSY